MIGSIDGTIGSAGIDWLVVQTTGGVGYLVATTAEVATAHPVGSSIHLLTHLVVREDQLSLYGFLHDKELRFFQQLISVSGVGPKMALAVLNAGHVDSLQTAISQNDTAILTTISGVGRKTAERIVVELKNKMGELAGTGSNSDSEDLLVALTQLGYNAYEVRRIAMEIPASLTSTEDRLKHALKLLAK
jgi:Holliday junction DNA helicase RuvA